VSAAAAPVGFIGLGQIGGPMAGRLVDWPGGLVVCDARPEACEPLVAEGANAVATPAEVAATGATVISVMVRDDAQVWDVLDGPDGILATAAAGTVVAVHSTIGADTAADLAARAARSGVAVVDAPVSGGFVGAHEGTLAVMVGGDEEAAERCRAPFERFASLVLHFGPVGSGTRAKIARNLVTFASFAAAAEAQRLAEASGISLSRLARVVRHSDAVTGGAGAVMLRRDTAPLAPDDPLRPIMEHTAALGAKDLGLALELAGEVGVDLPLATVARARLAEGLGVGEPATPGSNHEETTP
jgi:3-hydroxyisobutyrate dehydrogenase